MNKRHSPGKVSLSNTIIWKMPGVYIRLSFGETFENETKGIFKYKGHSFQARNFFLSFFKRSTLCRIQMGARTPVGCVNAAMSPRPSEKVMLKGYLPQQVLMLINPILSEACDF